MGWEDPLEKGKVTHSSILAKRIPWTIVHGITKSQIHDWATFTLLHLTYVNHPGIKQPQDPRASNTTELTPAQATDPVQIGRDSMHLLTLGPWLKDDLSFTIGLSTIPRAGGGNVSRHLLALKTFTQKTGLSLPLPFHWPKQGPWPYLTARGQRSILNCVLRRRNVEAVNTLMSQTLWEVSHTSLSSLSLNNSPKFYH